MNFSELETLMSSRGVTTLAEIARTLDTTPQAVSNWKARNQVPHHIAAKLSQLPPTGNPQTSVGPPIHSSPITPYASPSIYEEDTISLSDILLTMAEQLKVIVLTTFVSVFLTFTYVKFIQVPQYESWATVLLPSSGNLGGLSGLASQFGVNVSSGTQTDLSSPTLLPDLLQSRTFAEKILDKTFYTEQYGKELPLLAILTHGDDSSKVGRDTLITRAWGIISGMLEFQQDISFSVIKATANEPLFAKSLAEATLDELENLNSFYKSETINEKISFISNRIASVENDLESSETNLKEFNERNRQISSPALLLEQNRLTRDVEVQKGVYLTLRQQLELAKIEEVQQASILQVLDKPQIPLKPSNTKLKLSVFLSGIIGLAFGVIIGFLRAYADNSDIKERKKLRRVKYLFNKKIKDIFKDYRFSGIVSLVMLIGLPLFLGYESKNPSFFGMYSKKLLIVNAFYVLALISCSGLFLYLFRKK